jgi:N-acyl-D-amino-acid deacylase
MDYDIVIRGGSLVDGSGADVVVGDVAIKDGMIAAVGVVEGSGAREIDADGHIVTPGFVDIHTHLDAQMGWDPDMTPVSWHGVTTALIGNCGMTFAPCKPEDRELLAGMMETVEDIPKQAILGGLAWDWVHYGEYLNSIERLGTAVNVAGMVGHAAVRYFVMGDRSFADDATDGEIREMEAVVERSMADGAWGFSTNRFEPHRAPDGRSIPGTFANIGELERISKVVGARDGLVQSVGAEFDVIRSMADASKNRCLFSYALELYDDGARVPMGEVSQPAEGSGRRAAASLDALCDGRDITTIAHVRGSGFILGLQSNLPVQGEAWIAISKLDLAGRLAAINNPETAARLVEEGKAQPSGVPINRVFSLGADDVPDYTNVTSLQQEADAAGEHWVETFLRVSRETNGLALFNYRMFAGSLKEQGELFRSDNLVPGLGDAGAHVSQIMDAGWSTFMLSYWHREAGVYSLPEVIERMTNGPARVVGLSDRGLLQEGMRADINVIDLDEVAELQPELVHDFPGGAPRYIQRAKGFKATIVNGEVSLLDGELTGTRAGKVLRHVG